MMNPDSSSFSAILAQECVPFDPNQNKYAIGALLGVHSIDQMDFYHDLVLPTFGFSDFLEQAPVQVDLSASPGALSSPSLPPSPFSLADDLSDLSVADAPTPYNPDLSPIGLSALTPLMNTEDVKPIKADLDGLEYNHFTRKWVCTKCDGDFVSAHEARRHVKTAAKCTGKKVKCLRCGDPIHASPWSRKRHFGSKKCQKKGRKRGAHTYTVNNAYVEL
ncbi:hypothetical protein BDM02DRAFT_3269557 [Thelephora ganbajun]|uniref:Uncharacterized protein n=1 Tax=Thelephora ganbajun TaxID=370292 RepID=A0ACB6ZFI0_THEGA|nr:hypothetical protein BDM02DRAFT_3269557 [Thelephora ganbajun]